MFIGGKEMPDICELKLKDLQPSQFYISERKLREVNEWFHPADLSNFEPIPVKMLDGIPVMTDGHTRAVAAVLAGLDKVPLVWDEDELSWEIYRRCILECKARGIHRIFRIQESNLGLLHCRQILYCFSQPTL